MTKRGKLEIMRDILKIIQEHKNLIKPTPLLRKSGLSSASFKEYYTELLERGLAKEIKNSNQESNVILTETGYRFLERYKSIVDFIDEFDL